MNINDSLYFDIIVGEGKDAKSISLTYSDLLYFKLTEYTGCAGIMTECGIRLHKKEDKKLFIQNNPVIFKLGESKDKCISIRVEPTEPKSYSSAGDDVDAIVFAGVLSVNFLYDRRSAVYQGNSLDVLLTLLDEYFTGANNKGYKYSAPVQPIEKMSKKNTKMGWIRNYNTGLMFMQEAWLHMDLGANKCPIIAITKEGELKVRDINDMVENSATTCVFTQRLSKNSTIPEYVYINKFNPESYKFDSNMYLGYGAVLNIKDLSTGKESVDVLKGSTDIASTKVDETNPNPGFKFLTNKYKSTNTHSTYKYTYYKNLSRLVQLSSIVGHVDVSGYVKDVNVLDMVELKGMDPSNDGRYIVNTKVVTFGSNAPITTTFYLCRDNKNYIENAVVDKTQVSQKLIMQFRQELANSLQSIRNLRRMIVMARQVLDGTFVNRSWAYLNRFKYNMLSSFTLFGTMLNLNDISSLLTSLKAAGNSFCNQIINRFIPYPFNYILKNIAIEHPSWKTLLSRLLNEFAPTNEIGALLAEIAGLFADLSGSASKLYDTTYRQQQINEYDQGGYGTLSGYNGEILPQPYSGDNMNIQDDQNRIQVITNEFINNTEGLDIPIPQVSLTESESLLPDGALRDLLADKTVEFLNSKGYLEDIENFKNILLGIDKLDSNTISLIERNSGDKLYARYWGTFKEPSDLSDYFIKNSFKDIYATVPTTKIVNALKGSRVFMALPATESNLRFYLNNKEVNMEVIENMELGLFTSSGIPLMYNVYMSSEKFHSNSVIFEVRQPKS